MTRRAFTAAALSFLAFLPLDAQELALETILIRNRPAEDLVPVVRPLVGENGSVTAFGGRLIVKASPRALREIKQLVEQLDVVPRSLWITVRQSREAETSGRTVGGDVTVERRDGKARDPDHPRTRVRGRSAKARRASRDRSSSSSARSRGARRTSASAARSRCCRPRSFRAPRGRS